MLFDGKMERHKGENFMFELTKEDISRCLIGILNKEIGNDFKYMPFTFTELGVAMLIVYSTLIRPLKQTEAL